MAYTEIGSLTITTTGATSETQTSVSMNGALLTLLFSQTAGSTFPSTTKVTISGATNGQVILSSGQVLSALTESIYPAAAFNGSTGGALTAYTEIPMINEGLSVTVIHGTTTIHGMTVKPIIDGQITKTA